MIDLSDVFPEYEKAEGDIEQRDFGPSILVRLYSGGSFSTIRLRIDKIANGLEKIRRAQAVERSSRKEVA